MLRINSIRASKKTGFVELVVAGNCYSFTTDTVAKYQLSVGQQIEKTLLEDILHDERIAEYKRKAHNHISYKPRTENQIKKYLSIEGANEKEIIEVVKFMYEFDLLDDARYAEMYVNDLFLKRPMGREKILYELLKRGVKKTTAKKALDNYSTAKEVESIKKLSEKRLYGKAPKNKKEYDRELKYFRSRGFSTDMIKELFASLE